MPTTLRGNDNFDSGAVLGVGQTWQNLTASRAYGTTYTNSTGRPILVSTYSTYGSPQSLVATVSGVTVVRSESVVPGTSQNCQVQFIVPAGATYSVAQTGGGVSLSGWAELR